MRSRLGATFAAGLLLVACGGDGEGEGEEVVRSPGGVELGPADEGIDGVVALRIESHEHTESAVEYERQPPAGGAHSPAWLNCGFYAEQQPTESLVHSLEHGAVWLAYDPGLDPEAVAAVRDLTRSNAKVVATPYESLPDEAAVVATAWARQLAVPEVPDPRLAEFIDAYLGGDSAPEPNAPCEGAIGEPE